MQNERITLIELQNKNQDDGIHLLKTEFSKHLNPNTCQMNKNKPDNMIKRQPFYPPSDEKENGDVDDDVKQHVIREEKQRAARLLPLSLLAY